MSALALVGSGEYTPAMESVDRALLATLGGPQQARVVVLPTASGLEPGMPEQWNARGVAHFERLGAQVTPIPLITREDAHSPEIVAALAAANFFYLSGGNPEYAVEVWRDTPAWRTLVAGVAAGAALAGCSAGAMMLGPVTISIRRALSDGAPQWRAALGLAAPLVTMPHFDRIAGMLPAAQLEALLTTAPAGSIVVGVDEDTALVQFASGWQALGRQSVTVFGAQGAVQYASGAPVNLPLLDLAAPHQP
jgi:cyanophycinase-like exopeptidase